MVNLSRKREIRTIVETYLALTQKSSFFPPQTGSGMFHCIPRKRFQQGRFEPERTAAGLRNSVQTLVA